MANKYKAGDYKGSGMSKSQYEASQKGSSTSSKSSGGGTDISAMLKSAGISQADYDALSPNQQSAFTLAHAAVQKRVSKNQPVPDVLSKKEMNKLWDEAKNDPTITNYYADQLKQATDIINTNTATDTQQFQQMTQQQQQKYIQDKLALDDAASKAGQAYSGFRGQAKNELDTANQDTIQSTTAQLQSELDQLGQQFEQKYGTGALAGTALGTAVTPGNIGSYNNTPYAGPTGAAVQYSPMGNVTGTQASAELASQLNEQQELAADKEQGISIKNFKYNMLPAGTD